MFRWQHSVAFALGFAASRMAWWAAGVRFHAVRIDSLSQLLDRTLLEHRLLESLWYLHAQPPIFNLLTGLALKLSPEAPGAALAVFYHACGLLAGFAVAGTLRGLGIGAWAAVALALAFVSTPAFVLYEHWHFYPHLAAALLSVAAGCFLRSGGHPNRWLAAGFWALAALALVRSLFHPFYLLLSVAVAAGMAPRQERLRVLGLAGLPAGLVLLWALKNAALFGFFGTSSWGGNSLHRVATASLGQPALIRMVSEGELQPISLHWQFSSPEVYLEVLERSDAPTGVPALDATRKTRSSRNPVNYNHWIYPVASRAYMADALHLLRRHPDAYLRSLRWSSRRFLEPVTAHRFVRPIAEPVEAAVTVSEAVERSSALRALALVAVLYGGWALLAGRVPRRERLFLAFALGTVIWVSVVGVALEHGENNRFRYQLLPLVFLLVMFGVRDGLRSRRPGREAP